MTARVEFLDAEPNGIAAMLGGLIQANLAAHPERERLLRRPASVGIVAEDAHVALTLHLEPGLVRVANGLAPQVDMLVRTDSMTLTQLSTTPLRLGFPDAVKREGRAVTRKLFKGTLTVKGLARRPRLVSRVNRLLSVA